MTASGDDMIDTIKSFLLLLLYIIIILIKSSILIHHGKCTLGVSAPLKTSPVYVHIYKRSLILKNQREHIVLHRKCNEDDYKSVTLFA